MASTPQHPLPQPAHDARLARRADEGRPAGEPSEEFRIDLERIALSPYFSRLTAVTQVLSQTESTQVIHNRMTHSIKVASSASAIADALCRDEVQRELIERLGGCDPFVAQAAGWAHDIGHPPFGHSGEQALDRLARSLLGLPEGFEGNAQTFRTLVQLDVDQPATNGLNLTAAVRASVLKYPWARRVVHPVGPRAELPVGARDRGSGLGPAKMSAYVLDLPELLQVRSAYPELGPWRQTLESSVMDLADDITYALHDLDDFYRAGVLAYPTTRGEFTGWLAHAGLLRRLDADELHDDQRPGAALELLRRRAHAHDPWAADDDAFEHAVRRVLDDLIEGVLARPFDGSLAAQRTLSAFVSAWTTHLQGSVVLDPDPPMRTGHVRLDVPAWHEIAVLKFVHSRFVLERPELGLYRRGQFAVLRTLVDALDRWIKDPDEATRVPARLLDFIELARADYRRTRAEHPELLEGATSGAELERMAHGRGILDYVASLTDEQAHDMAATITGRFTITWGGL